MCRVTQRHPNGDLAGGPDRAAAQGLVIVVDDEESLRELLRLVLRSNGYAVQTAAGGEQALGLYRQCAGAAPLVLLDRKMPGLDGMETLAALREIDPQVRCCLMTGDSAGYTDEELAALGVACVLHKPFRLDEVIQVARLLADCSRATAVARSHRAVSPSASRE